MWGAIPLILTAGWGVLHGKEQTSNAAITKIHVKVSE